MYWKQHRNTSVQIIKKKQANRQVRIYLFMTSFIEIPPLSKEKFASREISVNG